MGLVNSPRLFHLLGRTRKQRTFPAYTWVGMRSEEVLVGPALVVILEA